MAHKNHITCALKVSIIGCGSVGATTAYAYLLSGTVTDLTIVDVDKKRAKGLMLDLEHALSFTPHMQITATDDFSKIAGSNLVVVTAGKRQAKGETRLDLVKANKEIFKNIIPKIATAAPDSIMLIVSNPVDVLTYQAIKLAKFPEGRVFGSGTLLDSSRLQSHISKKIRIHPNSIDAYVLGEHGDTSFPVYSSANVLGKPLKDFDGFSQKEAENCYEDTRKAAYRIINDQGYTCYSIATAIREITEAIFQDQHKVFPLSVPLKNYYGHSNVCLSVPCIVGQGGVEQIIKIPLNAKEKINLAKSVKTIKQFL
ncbi:L-lactate dehydrogenase [Candidatus Peregrinibacteria bacterium CG_4_10_14_0_2_um_filter_38_24]|nr:MAG: L-lactate dehydrogenase [Candidatus Peregrinibacteria bacterium CG_4_10_14_0_2_um_filter_38_24]PJC39361.1 MAG: L-lactate dehydrogenase [Candidatus Peregrinibacteria bacterium CG_4_9_14_0_2_um_filter_38_9]